MIQGTMKPGEGAIYPESSIKQMEVGALSTEVMAYSSGPQIVFHHKITLRVEDRSPGWGKVIFEGTLKELIELVQEKEVNGGPEKHS